MGSVFLLFSSMIFVIFVYCFKCRQVFMRLMGYCSIVFILLGLIFTHPPPISFVGVF